MERLLIIEGCSCWQGCVRSVVVPRLGWMREHKPFMWALLGGESSLPMELWQLGNTRIQLG